MYRICTDCWHMNILEHLLQDNYPTTDHVTFPSSMVLQNRFRWCPVGVSDWWSHIKF